MKFLLYEGNTDLSIDLEHKIDFGSVRVSNTSGWIELFEKLDRLIDIPHRIQDAVSNENPDWTFDYRMYRHNEM